MTSNRTAVLLYFAWIAILSVFARDATPLVLSGIAFVAFLAVDSLGRPK